MSELLHYIQYYCVDYKWGKKLKSNWQQFHSGRAEKLCFWLLIFIFIAATVFHIINTFMLHNISIWVGVTQLTIIPIIILMMMIGCILESKYPRIGLTVMTFGLLSIMVGFTCYICGAVSSTAFPLIDHPLLHIDQLVHFSTVNSMAWVQQHPYIHKALSFSYNIWAPESLCIALFCAAMKDKIILMRYINSILLTTIIGSLIYYFLPSCGPASLLHSPYFPSSETVVYPTYYAIHFHGQLKDQLVALIAFPSFHVINSVLICHVLSKYWITKNYKWRIPITILFLFNILLIASTLMLGHHYIADVIAGFIIAVLSWQIVKKFESKKISLLSQTQ